ncbi:MAG: ferredoxin-like diferric-tyrosyl radical cofactor maintenance protein YfaE [Sodalis sp. Fse]|nr:MAG: ferredoxin-like diferric-tyrosyl radical cofactor maintenance protein YfaE [Sodalis sp. Fse]
MISNYKPMNLIRLRYSGTEIPCKPTHSSLLQALVMHQVTLEFQCCSGYCGTCRLQLLSGEVKYNQKPLAFIQHGEILPCCCLPVEDIELKL